jgi:cytochrome b subunit of formate dehydrogenase
MVVLTILFFLAVCGLIIWANFAFADGQYQLQIGGLLLTALVPIA